MHNHEGVRIIATVIIISDFIVDLKICERTSCAHADIAGGANSHSLDARTATPGEELNRGRDATYCHRPIDGESQAGTANEAGAVVCLREEVADVISVQRRAL